MTLREIHSKYDMSSYDIPEDFLEDATLNPYRCPRCNGRGVWRMGAMFDHMKRCPECRIVWTPDSVVTLHALLAEELQGVQGDGI